MSFKTQVGDFGLEYSSYDEKAVALAVAEFPTQQ